MPRSAPEKSAGNWILAISLALVGATTAVGPGPCRAESPPLLPWVQGEAVPDSEFSGIDLDDSQRYALREWLEQRISLLAVAPDAAERSRHAEQIAHASMAFTVEDYDRLIPLFLMLPQDDWEIRSVLPKRWFAEQRGSPVDTSWHVADPAGLAQLFERPVDQSTLSDSVWHELILAHHGSASAERNLRDAVLRCADADSSDYRSPHCVAVGEYRGKAQHELIDDVWPVITAEQRLALLAWLPSGPNVTRRLREQLAEESEPRRRRLLIEQYAAADSAADLLPVIEDTVTWTTMALATPSEATLRDFWLAECREIVPMLDAIDLLSAQLENEERRYLTERLYHRGAQWPDHGAACLMSKAATMDAGMEGLVREWLLRRHEANGMPGVHVLRTLMEHGWTDDRLLDGVVRRGSSRAWLHTSMAFSDAQWHNHMEAVVARLRALGAVFDAAVDDMQRVLDSDGEVKMPADYSAAIRATQEAVSWMAKNAPDRLRQVFHGWSEQRHDWLALMLVDQLGSHPEFDPDQALRSRMLKQLAQSSDPMIGLMIEKLELN